MIICLNLELVNERTSFGRKGDCNISGEVDNRLQEISGIHFTITKTNPDDAFSPVFLEVKIHFVNIIFQ